MYKFTNGMAVLRIADNVIIPFEPQSQDLVDYQNWVKAGNNPAPADPKPTP